MAIIGTRVTASEVVYNFKALFMKQVKEAAELPDRHLYAEESDDVDDEESAEQSDENGSKPDARTTNHKISFKSFIHQLGPVFS